VIRSLVYNADGFADLAGSALCVPFITQDHENSQRGKWRPGLGWRLLSKLSTAQIPCFEHTRKDLPFRGQAFKKSLSLENERGTAVFQREKKREELKKAESYRPSSFSFDRFPSLFHRKITLSTKRSSLNSDTTAKMGAAFSVVKVLVGKNWKTK
jgi:hypothetical protein